MYSQQRARDTRAAQLRHYQIETPCLFRFYSSLLIPSRNMRSVRQCRFATAKRLAPGSPGLQALWARHSGPCPTPWHMWLATGALTSACKHLTSLRSQHTVRNDTLILATVSVPDRGSEEANGLGSHLTTTEGEGFPGLQVLWALPYPATRTRLCFASTMRRDRLDCPDCPGSFSGDTTIPVTAVTPSDPTAGTACM